MSTNPDASGTPSVPIEYMRTAITMMFRRDSRSARKPPTNPAVARPKVKPVASVPPCSRLNPNSLLMSGSSG